MRQNDSQCDLFDTFADWVQGHGWARESLSRLSEQGGILPLKVFSACQGVHIKTATAWARRAGFPVERATHRGHISVVIQKHALPNFLEAKDIAAHWGVHLKTVYRWRSLKGFPALTTRSGWRVRTDEFVQWMREWRTNV